MDLSILFLPDRILYSPSFMIPYAVCLLVGGLMGYLLFRISTNKNKEKVDTYPTDQFHEKDHPWANDMTTTLRQRGGHMMSHYDPQQLNPQEQLAQQLPSQQQQSSSALYSSLPRPHGNINQSSSISAVHNTPMNIINNHNIIGNMNHRPHVGTVQHQSSELMANTNNVSVQDMKKQMPPLESLYPPPPLPPPKKGNSPKHHSRSPSHKRRGSVGNVSAGTNPVVNGPGRQSTPDLYLNSTSTPNRNRSTSLTTSCMPPEDSSAVAVRSSNPPSFVPSQHKEPSRVVHVEGATQATPPNPEPSLGSLNDNRSAFSDSQFAALNINDIEFVSVIGGGAFGQVWKGIWQGTPVAVKVLSSAVQADVPSSVLQAFRDEVQMLARMRHPNICLFLGACLDPPKRAIVTEIVSRGSLWDALRTPHLFEDRGKGDIFHWPWWVIRRVLDGTCRGLIYMHGNDPPIIHRDLKSANILLDDSFNVKICDFGLARLKDFTRTMTANVGTAQWTAPEVLAGKEYNESADIYSMGIVAWELLTGKCPYEHTQNQVEIAVNVTHHKIRPIISERCPRQVRGFIENCWSEDPAKRMTAREALKKLETVIPVI